MKLSSRELVQEARNAGYHVTAVEQLRANRWLLTLSDQANQTVVVLVQARPLISAVDVHDLAEIVQLRRPNRGLLLAYEGAFSPSAQRALAELDDSRLRLCRVLPPSAKQETPESQRISAVLKSVLS